MTLRDAAARYLPSIEDELRAVVELAGHHGRPDDYMRMLTYHMGWMDAQGVPVEGSSGKRIRPLLCLMVVEAADGDWQQAVPIAAAIELVHNFSLVHDDIQDRSELRRGSPTVWKLWGMPQAINAGDVLFALAHLAAKRLSSRGVAASTTLEALRLLDETCLLLTVGQHLDLAFEERHTVDTDDYLKMIGGKSAALVAASSSLGAMVAGATASRQKRYHGFGQHLGIAFQIIDDILGIWGEEAQTGKSKESDLQTKKKTLPVVYGLESSDELRRLYAGSERLTNDEISRAGELLDEVGARAYAENLAQQNSDLALEHLAAAEPQGQAAEWLHLLTDELLRRDR